jgi:hypothetical protein
MLALLLMLLLQGVTYPDALFLKDFTQDLPLVHQEGRGHAATAHFGGYALVSCCTHCPFQQ